MCCRQVRRSSDRSNGMNRFTLIPESCLLCGTFPLQDGAGPVCSTCLRELDAMPGPFHFALGTTGLTCHAAREYAGIAKRAIECLKFSANRRLAPVLSKHLLEPTIAALLNEPFQVVPVPASVKGRRKRGFDQTQVLAGQLPVPLYTPLRRRRGKQQKKLSRTDRYSNAADNYILSRTLADGNGRNRGPVVLLDDVLTTGASLCRCVELLQSMDVNVVCAVVCAVKL